MPNLTPSDLATVIARIQSVREECATTIIVHPSRIRDFQAWLDQYEFLGEVTLVPNEYCPRETAYMFPSKIIKLPGWLDGV